jgi:hypothetical protein
MMNINHINILSKHLCVREKNYEKFHEIGFTVCP